MTDPVQNPYITPGSAGSGGDANPSIKGVARVGMIITLAMVQGIVVITAIILYLTIDNDKLDPNGAAQPRVAAEPTDWLMPGLGLLFGLIACVAAFVVTRVMKSIAMNKFRQHNSLHSTPHSDIPRSDIPRSGIQSTPQVTQLLGALQTKTIVGQVILEGAAVINAVFMMIDGNLIHLAVIGILIAGILFQLPTVSKYQAMIDEAVG
ncbi:MAG: hypothetical protein WBD20_18105 [Pirellulaceae bacterium]